MDYNLDKYLQAVKYIHTEQTKIIGLNIANMLAQNVHGLSLGNEAPQITGDPKTVLQELVDQYATIFGKASIMVSKEAIKKVNPSFAANELPDNLK